MTRLSNKTSLREFRRRLGMNQIDFWAPLGVTQSGGSRYEAGRSMPKPVVILLNLAYGSEKESAKMLAALQRSAK